MNKEINLLSSLPKSKRDIKKRAGSKDDEVILISRQFGKEYFDGDRKYGYGGYHYDGRWIPVAKDIIKFFGLTNNSRILDIGCAKGFLLHDLLLELPDAYVRGIDVSSYAINNSHPAINKFLKFGTAYKLPYKEKSFDLVISINTLHNLPRPKLIQALREIEDVSMGSSYVVVDSYLNKEQKDLFESWVLTAKTHGYPHQWREIFREAGYTGYYGFNILEGN